MKILVTGAAGSLGRRLAARLESKGDVWRAVRPGGKVPKAHPERTLAFDIADGTAAAEALARVRPDCVAHLAAYVDVQGAVANPLHAWRTNLSGTLHLLEGLRQEGLRPRFLLASTAHVYGPPVGSEELIGETQTPHPVSPYAASKLAAEHAALVYFRQYGIESIVVRIFNVVGPGQPASSVCSALALRVAALAAGRAEPPLQAGNLAAVRDFIPVEDAVAGLAAAVESGRPGETYNLCTGRGTSVREILEGLFAAAGKRFPVETDAKLLRAVDPGRVVGDPEKLARDTGFRAKGDVSSALAELYRESLSMLREGGQAAVL